MQEPLDYYLDLVENTAHMVQSVSPDGLILYVNPAWRGVFGYDETDVQGLHMSDLVHPDYRADYLRLFEQVKAGEPVSRFETMLLTRDQRPVTIEGSCNCRFKDGRPDAILSVFQDITERKRAEEVLSRQAMELLNAHASLEEKDRELADTLEQARQYREAQKRAEALLEINEELKQEIERRRQAEAVITASLQEKEVLLKEIHHRVKNNLQVISSLLNLQSEALHDTRILDLFQQSQDRIQSMALIHEMLYQSEDLAQVNFSDYLQSLVSFLVSTYGTGSVRVRVDVERLFLNLDTAIPCGLMVNELVSNALKYAFPNGQAGELYIGLRPEGEGQYTLTVGDTGVGLPDGMDIRKTESLGLQLVVTLTEQLDGTLELDCGRGTEFRIRFQAQTGPDVDSSG